MGGRGRLDKWLSGLADPLSACHEMSIRRRLSRQDSSGERPPWVPQCTDMPRPTSCLASRTLHTLTWPLDFLFLLPTSPTGLESHGFHLLLSGQRDHVRFHRMGTETSYTLQAREFQEGIFTGGIGRSGAFNSTGTGPI